LKLIEVSVTFYIGQNGENKILKGVSWKLVEIG